MDLDKRLNLVDYGFFDKDYRPTQFALEFIAFVKMVNGSMGEENKSPIIHYDMLDQLSEEREKAASNFIQNLYVSFRGSAKALPLSTLIHTPTGRVPMGSLGVGDTVIDRNGEPTKIKAESQIFNKPIYRITLEDGRYLDVSEDHYNIVQRVTTGGKFKEEELTIKEMIKLGLFFNRKVSYHNPTGREIKWYIPLPKPVKYSSKKLDLDPYTVGVILGDGSSCKRSGHTRIHTHVDDCAEMMSNIPYKTGTVRCDKRRPTTLRFSIGGIGKLVKLVIGTESVKEKKIPEEYLLSSIEQRYELLRGLMDTDGTISKQSYSFTTASDVMAQQFCDLVRSLGGRANLTENNWDGFKSYRISIFTPENPFKLKRKAEKWRPCKTNKLKRVGIVDVQLQETVPSKCIAVESETRSFLAKDYIVTRNTTALHEYMFLYLATYGGIKGIGEINVAMYISDTMENGVKSMRNNLEFRWSNSEFLQKYVPVARFTDVRWQFENADGKRITIRGFGATTGVRGFKEYGERPTWCSLDDLMSDKNSESPTIIRDIKNIVYKAARQAMHPKKRIVVWTGTPFNKSDPFYEAASGKAWNVRVYPICEKFPCSKEEFRGAWEDRFPYSFVKNEYYSLLESGEISSFNQELMLRITSEESRLVMDSDLVWYNRDLVVKNRSKFNFYITTDFATSDGKKSDYSVCGVWAYTNNGEWLLVDGFCKRQLMDKNIDQLFRYVAIYRPLSVGIEINGQQKGFIQWLKGEMINRNIFFNFARQGSVEGIRRTGKKIASFKLFVPQIKAKKVWLPEEMKTDPLVVEILEEMAFVTDEGFQSKHDDASDMMSMLTEMDPYKPGEAVEVSYVEDEDGNHGMFVDDEDEDLYNSSTIF